ncbi:MAG: type I-E CRISPR-associated protein Cse1/CasA [Bowdeniella nasicola]|nr:type I-E CRISPR-associated protein Cse1/CasA [Bowdeniella nasicola]
MSTGSFNLLHEPWIRVLETSGTTSEVSLLELFSKTDEFAQLSGDFETQDIAILRLLLAIMHRAMLGPRTLDDWRYIWDNRNESLALVRDYLTHFEDRFDVRHPSQPFFQVADLRTKKGEWNELSALVQDAPGNAFLTMSRGRGLSTLTWAQASRWLVACHAYDVSGIHSGAVGDPRVKSGKGYGIGTGWAGQLGIIYVVGRNLWETLLLNLIPADTLNTAAACADIDRDLPPWEKPQQDQTTAAPDGVEPQGPVESYTWQSRRVRLVGEEYVHAVLVCQGDRIRPQNRQTVEPMTAWNYSAAQSRKEKAVIYMPQKFWPHRVIWSGLSALIPQLAGFTKAVSGDQVPQKLPSDTLTFAKRLRREYPDIAHLLGPITTVALASMTFGTQDAVYDEWVSDQVLLPEAILQASPKITAMVSDGLETTIAVGRTINHFSANLASAAGADPDVATATGRSLEMTYLFEAEGLFRTWLSSASEDGGSALVKLQHRLRSLAISMAQETLEGVSPSAYRGTETRMGVMNVGTALGRFYAALKRALPDAESNANSSLVVPESHDSPAQISSEHD